MASDFPFPAQNPRHPALCHCCPSVPDSRATCKSLQLLLSLSCGCQIPSPCICLWLSSCICLVTCWSPVYSLDLLEPRKARPGALTHPVAQMLHYSCVLHTFVWKIAKGWEQTPGILFHSSGPKGDRFAPRTLEEWLYFCHPAKLKNLTLSSFLGLLFLLILQSANGSQSTGTQCLIWQQRLWGE